MSAQERRNFNVAKVDTAAGKVFQNVEPFHCGNTIREPPTLVKRFPLEIYQGEFM